MSRCDRDYITFDMGECCVVMLVRKRGCLFLGGLRRVSEG